MRKNSKKRLSLYRETLVRLDEPRLRAVAGGDDTTYVNCPRTRQPSVCRACEEPPPRDI